MNGFGLCLLLLYLFSHLQVEECMDSFNFEVAQKFCERALEQEPDNTQVLETAGAICLELGETVKAETVSF